MNIYAALAVGALSVGVYAGSIYLAYNAGKDSEVAAQSRVKDLVEETRENSRKGTADALATLKPQIQVINQKVKETVREVPVYRECVHAPGMLDNINRALTGRPAGGGVVPGADPAR